MVLQKTEFMHNLHGRKIVLQGWSIYKSLSSCFFEVLSTIGYLRGCAFIPFGYSQKIYEQRWRTCIQQSRSIAVSVLERRREETGWESPRIWRVFTQVYAIRVRQQCATPMYVIFESQTQTMKWCSWQHAFMKFNLITESVRGAKSRNQGQWIYIHTTQRWAIAGINKTK